MKKSIVMAVVCMALCVSSCTTVRKTASTSDVVSVIRQYPTVADLDVNSKKVEKTYTWTWNPFKKGPSLAVLKGNIIAEMLKESDGDVLLEPQTIQTKKSFGERTLTVSGFSAKFKNFRKATDADIKALSATQGIEPNERTVYNVSDGFLNSIFKKKSK